MSTLRQIQQARANGARSKGPVTPEGKRASSRNARKHGLLASTAVIDDASKARFDRLLASFTGELQPTTPAEVELVKTITVARWRQMRVWALQKTAIDLEMAAIPDQSAKAGAMPEAAIRATLATRSLSENSRCLELLHRYETSCERQFLKALSTIRSNRRENLIEKVNFPNEPDSQNGTGNDVGQVSNLRPISNRPPRALEPPQKQAIRELAIQHPSRRHPTPHAS